jgi:hypothetical protein
VSGSTRVLPVVVGRLDRAFAAAAGARVQAASVP